MCQLKRKIPIIARLAMTCSNRGEEKPPKAMPVNTRRITFKVILHSIDLRNKCVHEWDEGI